MGKSLGKSASALGAKPEKKVLGKSASGGAIMKDKIIVNEIRKETGVGFNATDSIINKKAIVDNIAKSKGYKNTAEMNRYQQNNPNLYEAMGGNKFNPIPSKNPTMLTDEGKKIVSEAQKKEIEDLKKQAEQLVLKEQGIKTLLPAAEKNKNASISEFSPYISNENNKSFQQKVNQKFLQLINDKYDVTALAKNIISSSYKGVPEKTFSFESPSGEAYTEVGKMFQMEDATDTRNQLADFLSDDELKEYFRLYAYKGKSNADAYLSNLHTELESRKAVVEREEAAKYSYANPIKGSLKRLANNVFSASEQLGNYVKALSTGKVDRNQFADLVQGYSQGVTDKYDWKIGNFDAFDFFYNATMAGLDSRIATFAGGGQGIILGLAASASTTNALIDKGLDPQKALLSGTVTGILEGVFEELSLSKMDAFKETAEISFKQLFKEFGKVSLKQFLKQLGKDTAKSMGVNFSEEFFTEAANIAYDTLAHGDLSDYATLVTEYMKDNPEMTEAEAKARAAGKLALQMVEAGASGALMGAEMAPFGVISAYNNSKKINNVASMLSSDKGSFYENLSAADAPMNAFEKSQANITGYKPLTEDQQKLREIGSQFGAKVKFENLTKRYTDENGVEQVWSPEGKYDKSTNTIILNTDVQANHRPAMFILKHELAHSLEKAGISYEKFMGDVQLSEAFEEYAKSRKNSVTGENFKSAEEWYNDIIKRYNDAGVPLGSDGVSQLTAAKQEAIADFVADCLFTGNNRSVEKLLNGMQTKERNKFIAIIKEIIDKLKKVFANTNNLSEIERLENEFLKVADKVSNMNAKENAQQKTTESKLTSNENSSADPDTRYSLSSMANTFFGDSNMSANDFAKLDYKQTDGYKNYVDQCLNNMKQTRKDFDESVARKEIENSIEGIVRVAIAAKKAGYDIFDDNTKRNVKDSKNRLLFSSLEPNSEYFTSNDISTICDKRKNFAEIYDDIVRAEEEKGVPQGKKFFDNVDNYFYLHKVLADKGLTQPCRECYVESMRKNLAPMANAFLRLVNETDANNKANDQLYQQKGKNKGNLKTNNAKLREQVLETLEEHTEYNMSASDLTVEMLTTDKGLAQLRIQAPLIYEAFNSFYGQSKPKMPKSATPFRFGELTALLTDHNGKINQKLVERIESTGGFRLQSYSDFQIQNYTDVLQVIFEASTLGLTGHAYTKVPAFLDATEGTNLKRNISIFMYKDGDEWKLDKNDSFPYDLEEIYNIVKADKSGNTGIIAVSQNKDMSCWIMANDYIAYGIPFHKSGLKMGTVRDTDVKTEDGRIVKGYSGTIDHTKQQTEVWAKASDDHKALTKVKNGINIYSFWDFDNKSNLSKNELIEKNVKEYIKQCEIAGYLPKFRDYVINNDSVLNDVLKYSKELGFVEQNATIDDISFTYEGKYHTYRIPYGYYKFLGDFSMFTPDGKASPHDKLSLDNYDFDKAERFFADAEGLSRNEILQQFANGEERQKYRDSNLSAEQLKEIVRQKRAEVVEEIVPTQYSLSAVKKDDNPIRYSLPENPTPEQIEKYTDEIFEFLEAGKKAEGYRVYIYRHTSYSNDATITIKRPDNTKNNIRYLVEGGRYWTNSQLRYKAANIIVKDIIKKMPKKNKKSTAVKKEETIPPIYTPEQIGEALKNGDIDMDEYKRLINESFQYAVKTNGAIKPGEIVEDPNKPNPTPQSVKEDTKVSEHIRTILESGYATPEMETYLKERVLEGLGSYTPTSNEKNINKAVRNINAQGFQNALSSWRKSLEGINTSANTVATGEALLRLAMEHRDSVDVVNIAADLAELSTRTGQALQAFSLLKRMGGIGQLVYIQRAVNKLNNDLQKRFEKSKQDAPVVKIDHKLASKLTKADTEGEYESFYEAIIKDVAEQVPPTFLDKWNAWRYMAMLFNPTTHFRNFFGNGLFLPAVRTKDVIALALEKSFVGKENRTKVLKVKEKYRDFAMDDFERVEKLLTGTGKYNPSDNIRDEQRIFKSKILEGIRKFNFNLLEKEDLFFLRSHYVHALGSFLQSRGINLSEVTTEQLDEARGYAFEEALKATYRDASKVANIMSSLSKTSPFANVVFEGIMPFKKTPINVLKRGVSYSPIGLIKSLSYGVYQLNRGSITSTQFIDGLASGATGTIPCVIGALLASLGVVKGGFDDEEEIDRLMGKQEYSVTIGNKSYTIDWAAPSSIPFFIGVAMQEYKRDEDGDFLSNIYSLGLKGFEPILNLSMLSGINDVINSVSYKEEKANIPTIVGTAVGSYFSQALPTIFGKTANVADDTRRTKYIDKTSDVPEIVQSALDKIQSKVPFVSRNRAEYIDAWGETKYTGNFISRFFQQFVSPGYASTVDDREINNEVLRLYRSTKEKTVIPSVPNKYFEFKGIRRDLSKEEYFEYSTLRGQTQAELLEKLINNKDYIKSPDEQKAEVVENIYKFVDKFAKSTLSYSYDEVAAMQGGTDVLKKEKWNKLDRKAKRLLVNDYFFDNTQTKAYRYYSQGKDISEIFIKQVIKNHKK